MAKVSGPGPVPVKVMATGMVTLPWVGVAESRTVTVQPELYEVLP
jgi:hypothetical protein